LHNFNSPEKVQLRRQYALSNTYEKQIERIELLVRSQKLLN